MEWAEGKNVAWKVALPGDGKSTPVVWRDLILLSAALPFEKKLRFVVLALGRADGKVRWSRTLREEVPHEGAHQDGSFAAGSLLTDGTRIYAFLGSRGLYALDLEGRVLWEKDLGRMHTRSAFGEGASPALYGDSLVVNWDHEEADFVAAYDAKTGQQRWRTERDEPTT